MINIPNKINHQTDYSEILQDNEVTLTYATGFECAVEPAIVNIGIYRVCFNPEFTYQTGYIYIIVDSKDDIYRSAKYYRNTEQAEHAARMCYLKEDV